MNVLYCGDSNVGDGLMISVLSLLNHISCPLHIYVLTMQFETHEKVYEPLSGDLIELLDDKVRQKNEDNFVKLMDVSDLFAKELPFANLGTRFTPYCMLRLFADCLDALPDKILYLDNDVICRMDCTDFYEQEMGGAQIAGVLDYYGKWFFHSKGLRMDYLNSGVLLLDLKQIRRTGLFAKCREMCAQKKMFMPDQSALNKLCADKKILPGKYNEQRKLRKDTVFQHFTTSFRFFPYFHSVSVKPWNVSGMHNVLKLHEYDGLLGEYINLKEEFQGAYQR